MTENKTDLEYLQLALDQILEDETFKDMYTLVGKEITEQAALISIMQANLEKALEEYPNFKKNMASLANSRKSKIIAPKAPGLII